MSSTNSPKRSRKHYLIVVVAHSVHGRIRRIHIPHYAIHIVLSFALFGAIVGLGLAGSYARMLWKATAYNELRDEKEALQRHNAELQKTVDERNSQIASLGELANEVSIAFGIKRPEASGTPTPAEPSAKRGYEDFVSQYDFLQQVRLSPTGSKPLWYWLENTTPSVWPIRGRLSSSFGTRRDPFSGEGAFHPGVDIRSRYGSPVVAAADGMVTESGWAGQYGKRVVLSHGRNSLSTHYAHLSEFFVRAGEIVRRGQVIGRTGATGRTTSPHLHYEVRFKGTPVNPYRYLQKSNLRGTSFQFAD